MDNENNSNTGSRSENRGKKRKANRIYNILLTIVVVAIIAVAIPIFSGNDDDQSNKVNDTASSENNTDDNENSNTETNSTQEEKTEEAKTEDGTEEGKEDTADQAEEASDESEKNTIVENSDDSNVSETYVNDGWKPVGTTQTGEHTTNYSSDSVDWKEMTQALAYGAGLSANNMTVWYLGNGGATNKAIGTVSAKNDHATTYRVYIEWVDGQGWKPVKVELLKQNDKR